MVMRNTFAEEKPNALWRVASVEEAQARALADALGVSSSLAGLYLRRGLDTSEKIAEFCQPDEAVLHSPWLLPDMKTAVARLCRALDVGERIHVHGDYDVDGVTATAVIVYALRKLGADVTCYLPHRVRDGYGLNVSAVERAQANDATLLISADCGTDARDAAEAARQMGIDLIVTDHHAPESEGDRLPCVAVINPLRADSVYPFTGLSGVGVAYKTVLALCERRGLSLTNVQHRLLEFVALGTVVDMAPLTDENRVLAQMGLAQMRQTQKPGVRALLQSCGALDAELITSATLGYQLGPRLNAPGRIDDAREAFELLLAREDAEAQALCRRVNAINAQRKIFQAQTQQEALHLLMESGILLPAGALNLVNVGEEATPAAPIAALTPGLAAVASPDWLPGLTGSLASFLAESLQRPALVAILHPDGTASGSCRSHDGFPIWEALKSAACQELLTRCGGHAFACGFALPARNLPLFIERLDNLTQAYQEERTQQAKEAGLTPGQQIIDFDGEFRCEDVSLDTLRALARLSPFREDGDEPLLLLRDLQVVNARTIKKGEHLKLTLRAAEGGPVVSAMAWGRGADAPYFPAGARIDIAAHLTCDTHGGLLTPQLTIQDMRPART